MRRGEELDRASVWAEIEIRHPCCCSDLAREWARIVYRVLVFVTCSVILTYQTTFTGPLLFCAYTVVRQRLESCHLAAKIVNTQHPLI